MAAIVGAGFILQGFVFSHPLKEIPMARPAGIKKRAEWRRRLQRFHRGDLSVAEFCAREGVSSASFYTWRKKLDDAVRESPKPQPLVTADSFIPVEVIAPPDLHVAFPNGARLTVAAHDPGLVRTLIETLARTTRDAESEGAQ
jgi:hypothetical protein